MTGANILFVAIGVAALIGGLALLFTALRSHRANHPQANSPTRVAMLIGGMMVTAFGLMLTGFAIAYTTAGPAR
jgi:drug/metabolite transporter (DMT)-like permease